MISNADACPTAIDLNDLAIDNLTNRQYAEAVQAFKSALQQSCEATYPLVITIKSSIKLQWAKTSLTRLQEGPFFVHTSPLKVSISAEHGEQQDSYETIANSSALIEQMRSISAAILFNLALTVHLCSLHVGHAFGSNTKVIALAIYKQAWAQLPRSVIADAVVLNNAGLIYYDLGLSENARACFARIERALPKLILLREEESDNKINEDIAFKDIQCFGDLMLNAMVLRAPCHAKVA